MNKINKLFEHTKKIIWPVLKNILKMVLLISTVVLLFFLFLFIGLFDGLDKTKRIIFYYSDLVCFDVLLLIDYFLYMKKIDKIVRAISIWGILLVEVISFLLFSQKYHFPNFDLYWLTFTIFMYFYSSLTLLNFIISKETDNKVSKPSIISIAFYIFADFLYISLFKFENIATIIFGTVTFVIILFAVLSFFLSGKKISVAFIGDCFICFCILVLIIWKIPEENNNNLQGIVLQLIAALIGGILTMAGVVLTINYEKNKDKNNQIEVNKPLLIIPLKYNLNEVFEIPVDKEKYNSPFFNKKIVLKNVSNRSFKIRKIYINDMIKIYSELNAYIEKYVTFGICLNFPDDIDRIKMIIESSDNFIYVCILELEDNRVINMEVNNESGRN